jgi:hypothetical protein
MTDATTIYRALLVDEKTDASWDEYLRAHSRADDGRDPGETGPQSVEEFDEHVDRGTGVATDGGEDTDDEAEALPALHVGDHVQDRTDDDATLLVVGTPLEAAAEYTVTGEQTVADFNPEYDAGADVIEVIYPERTDVHLGGQQEYAFPRTRLELVAPIHDRSDAEADEQDTDDGRVEPSRSEPADFGGGESTGVQNL